MNQMLSTTIKATLVLLFVNTFTFTTLFSQNKLEGSRDVTFYLSELTRTLAKAPLENTSTAATSPLLLNLPMPEGGERQFKVVESPIGSADFAVRYPDFKTYAVVAADNPRVTGRLSVTPYGFNAFIHLEIGTMGIRPRDLLNPKVHQVYSGQGELLENASRCAPNAHEMEAFKSAPTNPVGVATTYSNGATRRTYRLAIVTTGEFTANNGGTTASAAAVVTASVNAIQSIYDRDLSVRFTLLVPVIYTDANSDPFTRDKDGGGTGDSRTNQAAEGVNTNFAIGNYDIGHVLHNSTTGSYSSGGVAGLGVVCSSSTSFATTTGTGDPNEPDMLTGYNKAAGWSGSSSNSSNGWYVLFAHEIGHMFNLNHTFNGSGSSSCSASNISATTAYEIASGNSLMSYNGICGPGQNIPDGGPADSYFHANSLETAVNFMGTITCHTTTATGNTAPVVNANSCGGTYTIPISTPFTLSGSGTDANGEVVYYSWEQYDEDGVGSPTQGFIGAAAAGNAKAPLFRSYPPTTSPSRTFPVMSLVASNSYASDFEPLPTVARILNFRLTGRDYNPNGGGVHCSALAVTVSAPGGAFAVSAPNGAESIAAGAATTVTWSTNTTAFCTNVNIKMSVDGGLTYPYTLATSVPNATGSQSVTLPSGVTATTTARIMVESADNACVKFFDISNNNFTVTSACAATGNTICNALTASFVVNNAGLNLGLSRVFGSSASTSQVVSVTAADPMGGRAMKDAAAGTTCTVVGDRAYKSFDFIVSTSGTYSFDVANASGGFIAASIFTAAGFTAATPCSSTFLGSNAYSTGGGGASSSSSFTVTLTACTLYKMMVYTSAAAYSVNTTLTPSGAGSVFVSGADPGGSYGFTYVAVNTSNSQVSLVNASSNFTSLPVGTYDVYGASHENTVNTNSWIGQTLSQVLSGGSCAQFSANAKRVNVTTALPIELLSLSATPLSKSVLLTWQTANEINNKGFQVERRQQNGTNWDILGFVSAKGKAADYNFEDNTPLSINYYRLRQIDQNGAESISKVVTAALNGKSTLSVYPNPANQFLTLETNEKGNFYVQNLLGQTVLTGQLRQQIDVSNLSNGTYIIKVGLAQAKFVKNTH